MAWRRLPELAWTSRTAGFGSLAIEDRANAERLEQPAHGDVGSEIFDAGLILRRFADVVFVNEKFVEGDRFG
jgi:hypothetical protein